MSENENPPFSKRRLEDDEGSVAAAVVLLKYVSMVKV